MRVPLVQQVVDSINASCMVIHVNISETVKYRHDNWSANTKLW